MNFSTFASLLLATALFAMDPPLPPQVPLAEEDRGRLLDALYANDHLAVEALLESHKTKHGDYPDINVELCPGVSADQVALKLSRDIAIDLVNKCRVDLGYQHTLHRKWREELKQEQLNVQRVERNAAEYAPLLAAIQSGDAGQVAKILSESPQLNLNVTFTDDKTPLIIACDGNSVEIVELLIEAKADPNYHLIGHDFPLGIIFSRIHYSGTEGLLPMASCLLKSGARPVLYGLHGEFYMLYPALQDHSRELVDLLIAYPIRLPLLAITPVEGVFEKEDVDMLKRLLMAGHEPRIRGITLKKCENEQMKSLVRKANDLFERIIDADHTGVFAKILYLKKKELEGSVTDENKRSIMMLLPKDILLQLALICISEACGLQLFRHKVTALINAEYSA